VKDLVDEAIDRGSEDNITVIIVKPPILDKKNKKKKNQKDQFFLEKYFKMLPLSKEKSTDGAKKPTTRLKSNPAQTLNITQTITQISEKKNKKIKF